jgi:hypothetical protein
MKKHFAFFLLLLFLSCEGDITNTTTFDPIEAINGVWEITTTKSGTTRTTITATRSTLNDGSWTYSGDWSGNRFTGNYRSAPYEAYISVTVESETRLNGYMSLKISIPGASKSTSDTFTGIKVK